MFLGIDEAEVRAVLESCLNRVVQQNEAQGSLPLTAGQATIIALSSLAVVSLAVLCLVVPSVREHVRDMAQHVWGYVQHLVAAMEACAQGLISNIRSSLFWAWGMLTNMLERFYHRCCCPTSSAAITSERQQDRDTDEDPEQGRGDKRRPVAFKAAAPLAKRPRASSPHEQQPLLRPSDIALDTLSEEPEEAMELDNGGYEIPREFKYDAPIDWPSGAFDSLDTVDLEGVPGPSRDPLFGPVAGPCAPQWSQKQPPPEIERSTTPGSMTPSSHDDYPRGADVDDSIYDPLGLSEHRVRILFNFAIFLLSFACNST